jgi:hypothetical protein
MKSLLVTAMLFLAACAGRPAGEENFGRVMDRQVGKHAEDADFYPTLYRLRLANTERLANGHTREEYAAGYKGRCKLYFELSPARRVVGWSTDGDRGECVIARPGRTE